MPAAATRPAGPLASWEAVVPSGKHLAWMLAIAVVVYLGFKHYEQSKSS